ncbi:hypothetical protein N0V93_002928 [Gnomoniopsis smithogilvyi]|uniref:Uncharacterized protein n=1 Tax=Gnomoniopsis smithogilvyi TaxID=1191159 RepID=A0A9W8YXL2_9PEZI|nr:hypothetical protein N0V93_002928 [Gnomoniopsis smithogilvyi]
MDEESGVQKALNAFKHYQNSGAVTGQQNSRAKNSVSLLERRSKRSEERFTGATGLAITIPPHQASLVVLQSRDSPNRQEESLEQQADLSARKNTSRTTPTKASLSQLKEPFTKLDTTPPGFVNSPRLFATQSQVPRRSLSSTDPVMVPDQLGLTHESSPTPGPARNISHMEIRPEKLKPFIGPLTKQRSPPNKPVPHPPIANTEHAIGAGLKAHSSTLSRTKNPSRQIVQSVKDKTPATDLTEASVETKIGHTSIKKKRTLLRKKVSTLFGEEDCDTSASRAADADHSATPTSTYRPISMISLNAGDNSFSDIFDDVFNAARDSASEYQRSTGPSFSSARPSLSLLSDGLVAAETAPRSSISARPANQHASRAEIAERLATRLGITGSISRKAILDALAEVAPLAPPSLTEHPALRGDLPFQARLGMITDLSHERSLVGSRGRTALRDNTAVLKPVHTGDSASVSSLHFLPLNVSRQRPTQVALSTRHASRSIVANVEPLTGFTTRSLVAAPALIKGPDDIDLSPAFDRSVDLTWYRYAKKADFGVRESSLPYLPAHFDALSSIFMVKYSRGRQSKTTAYDQLRRFAYFEMDGPIRFKIMEKFLEDHLPGKAVLLNHRRQASPAWAEDAFAALWEILEPLQNVIWACPRLRADVMTALFMLQPFHVIFSPFVKPNTQPLPTKWLFKYLYFMQDVRVELDMTKLGFGHAWQATGLSTRLWDIGNLVHVFVEEVLKRDPRTNPMGQLTIHCRRFFGYRQGDNPHRGDVNFYKAPVDEDDEQKPGNYPTGQPWNYGRKTPSLPPSANNPYSGHRRHHTGGPDRVPFVHEGHLSVANPFHKLTGRVCSIRMVGMSEKWSMDFLNFWPKSEHEKIPKENLGLHIDRYTPSRHTHAAPGHAIFLDYGVGAGIHRFPPLPDSEPMVCTVYDVKNDVFLELGSGKILTVKEGGIEIIARSKNPPMPRSDLPFRGSSPVSLEGIAFSRSRIPGPVGASISPSMQAMRKGTPKKALQLLGSEAGDDSMVTLSASPTMQGNDDDQLLTPTASSGALDIPTAPLELYERLQNRVNQAIVPQSDEW